MRQIEIIDLLALREIIGFGMNTDSRRNRVSIVSQRKAGGALASMIVAFLVLVAPSAANAVTPGTQEATANVASESAGIYQMKVDCSTFSEADRQRAIEENLSICDVRARASDGSKVPLDQNTNNCGTAALYVDSNNGKARYSYGLHSTKGIIILRDLYVNYGPAVAGTKHDFGAWGSESYSNTFTVGGVKGKKMGGTLTGGVGIAGWTFQCSVYAYEGAIKI